jgi:hypothetical protein
MHKVYEMIIGTSIGYIGYLYADQPLYGSYNIGIHPIIEYGGILFYTFFSFQSKEMMSTILLQAISGWHLGAVLK